MYGSPSKARIVELKLGDVVTPSMSRRPGRTVKKDVEDARFEVVEKPSDVSFTIGSKKTVGGVFQSKVGYNADIGPVPRDFAHSAGTQGFEAGARLEAFGEVPSSSSFLASVLNGFMAVPVVAMSVCAIVLGSLWISSGGLEFLAPNKTDSRLVDVYKHTQPSLSAQQSIKMTQVPDPIETSSIKATQEPSRGGYSTPTPKPARIDRAGSIYMIRSADQSSGMVENISRFPTKAPKAFHNHIMSSGVRDNASKQ